MQVALMVPCYIDIFNPEMAGAALELADKPDLDVVNPFDQTGCGHAMADSNCSEEAPDPTSIPTQRL